jgi:nucleoside 2-deoxyribosyltransferase
VTQLFISHAHRDTEIARAFAREFEHLGFVTFSPSQDIVPGENWRDAIRHHIKGSDGLVLVMASPEAAASSWMSYEAGMAEALGKDVIVLASQNRALNEVPSEFRSNRVISFDPQEIASAARRVAAGFKAGINEPGR